MSLKTIRAAVGENAANIPADVATVQYLLNCVPASQGGPQQELKIDGFAGVLTLEAIKRFQKFRFGSATSLVETSDQTFAELKKYDPLPSSAAIVPKLGDFDSWKVRSEPALDSTKIKTGVGFESIKWKTGVGFESIKGGR